MPDPAGPEVPRLERLDYVKVLNDAKAVVRASVLWKRFIDGTPLENDIAVWMADFAFQVAEGEARRRVPQLSGDELYNLLEPYIIYSDPNGDRFQMRGPDYETVAAKLAAPLVRSSAPPPPENAEEKDVARGGTKGSQ